MVRFHIICEDSFFQLNFDLSDDTTPVDMDLEPETLNTGNQQVDIDSELREFLESRTHDSTSIEQMLLE